MNKITSFLTDQITLVWCNRFNKFFYRYRYWAFTTS